jgi:predicted RNA binding protein YcfA (HicA-like mRNA interferase family)
VSPALSDLPAREVIRALESVGFAHARTRAATLSIEFHKAGWQIIPLHGTVKRGTLASILRQAGITAEEFLKLLD